MLSKNLRKGALFTFVSVATVLAVASVAFACTTYRGRFTVTGQGANGTTTSAVGGNGISPNTGMRYCNGVLPTAASGNLAARPAFSLTVGNADICRDSNGVNKLPATTTSLLFPRTYYIDYQPGASALGDCMHGSSGNQTIGKITVASDGSGSGSYPQSGYSYNPQLGDGSLCVSDGAAYHGNQVPLLLL